MSFLTLDDEICQRKTDVPRCALRCYDDTKFGQEQKIAENTRGINTKLNNVLIAIVSYKDQPVTAAYGNVGVCHHNHKKLTHTVFMLRCASNGQTTNSTHSSASQMWRL